MPGTGLVLDGAHWAETPDHISLHITGDVDMRIAVAMIDWTPATGQFGQVGISKWGTNNQSYGMQVLDSGSGSSGRLHGFIDNDGSGGSDGYVSTVAPSVSDGAILAYRAVLEGVVSRCTFYTKATTPSTAQADCASDSGWTQLGSPITDVGFTGIFSGSAPVRVGALESGGVVTSLLRGTVYAAVVKDGIDGTTVADPDFYANDPPFIDGAGRSWSFEPPSVTVGLATESDVVLSLARFDQFRFQRYPHYGTLGCGTWTVQVSGRGGSPVEVEVPAISVRMNRTEDEVSSASASFVNSDVPDWCIGALGDLEPWVYEMSLLRDGDQAWVGPISNQLTFLPSKVTIDARDLAAWMERRNLPITRIFNDIDITIIFVQLVNDALSRDPSPNISLDAMLTGLLIDKTVLSTDHIRAADALRDLAAFGVDFTMLGRVMRLRPRGGGDLLPNPLLDAHVLEEPQATLDGIQAASEWVVTGSTPGISATAGGVGVDTGLVTQSYNDPDITRVTDAHKAAVELLATSGAEPLTVTCVLDPDAPFAFNDLIPGNFIDTHLSFGHYQVNEVLMVTGLDVDAGAGTEKVSITLIRGHG